MADRASIENARKELEELYSGIPDESVNLTFQDLAEVRTEKPTIPEKERNEMTFPLSKLPSLDFSKAFPDSHHRQTEPKEIQYDRHHFHSNHDVRQQYQYHHRSYRHDDGDLLSGNGRLDNEMSFADSIMTSAYGERSGGRRRPGIPHSNICAICTNYIYIFRNRCLVCGRVYCRQCVDIGMGEMIEGRKCIDCLGRRFSQRYIQRAGHGGCCFKLRYPKMVIQQEIKWAEKGPRKNGERRYDQSAMSRSRSPLSSRARTSSPSPLSSRAHTSSPSPSSFIMSSPFSAYSPTRQPLPF